MKILHVVTLVDDQSSYGGPLTVAINQCRELRRQGHDAQLLAGWAGGGAAPDQLEGVPAQLFPVKRLIPGMRFSGLVSRPMLVWLQNNARSFDAAHLHLARDLIPLVAGVYLRRAGVPYVTQTHGMVLPDRRVRARMLDRVLTVPVLRDAITRFVLTQPEDDALIELLGPILSTERIPNGIAFATGDRSVTVPRQPGPSLDVLFMARLHPRKNVMDFARAALKIVQEGHDVRFAVAGPDDGDLPALMAFIDSEPDLTGRLQYEGPIPHDQTMDRLARADIFVLPSVDEPFPMTLLEALTAATPSICTTGCGIARELRADGAAMVIEPGTDALVAGLRQLLTSPRRRAALSAAGPRTARERFSLEAVGGQLLRAYRQEQEALV